jgi:rubrerythrin
MKSLDILQELDQLTPQTKNAVSRREALTKGLHFSVKSALAAVPLAFLLKANKSYAFDGASVIDILNFALTLEYLENEYYLDGLAASGLIPDSDKAIFSQISKHESAHVTLLTGAIKGAGGTPVTKPTFDFTAGGMYDPMGDYATFLVLSNAFEDTGVRAYKGQAGGLLGTDTLTVALDIHSVEARHASEVRRLRGQKGWITGKTTAGVPDAIYGGTISEDNTTQGGVDVTGLTPTAAAGIQEAFDEPLTMDEVLAIAGPFIKPA